MFQHAFPLVKLAKAAPCLHEMSGFIAFLYDPLRAMPTCIFPLFWHCCLRPTEWQIRQVLQASARLEGGRFKGQDNSSNLIWALEVAPSITCLKLQTPMKTSLFCAHLLSMRCRSCVDNFGSLQPSLDPLWPVLGARYWPLKWGFPIGFGTFSFAELFRLPLELPSFFSIDFGHF